MPWIRKGTKMEFYDSQGNLIKSYDIDIKNAHERGAGSLGMHTELFIKDGYKTNNLLISGQTKHVEAAIQKFLETGKMPSADEIGVGGGNSYENVLHDVRLWLSRNNIDEAKYALKPNEFIYSEEGGEKNPEAPEYSEAIEGTNTSDDAGTLNPYTAYLERQRQQQESAELGLLNTQNDAAVQNTEISMQQAMIQQAGLKDQLVEQIKTDRLSKMRSGLTPMQIAQEDLQFVVGNVQANNQNMQMVNQQRLAATQQKAMNPYQAMINANAAVTGGQGYGNVATGMAATDAGDLFQQALRLAKQQGRDYVTEQDYKIVSNPWGGS